MEIGRRITFPSTSADQRPCSSGPKLPAWNSGIHLEIGIQPSNHALVPGITIYRKRRAVRGRLALPRIDARAVEEVGAARCGAGAVAMVVAHLEDRQLRKWWVYG